MSRRDKTTNSIMNKVDNTSNMIKEISDNLVENCCAELDTIMNELHNLLGSSEELSTDTIQNYILYLANTLYFVGSAQEDLGIKEDTCKAIRKEVYSRAREDATGTVADKTTKAELISQQETVVLSIYSRAYKKVKIRMDAGYEMLNSLKKVMNKRITEMELSNSRYINHSEVE